jgi:N-methylhydantoinase A
MGSGAPGFSVSPSPKGSRAGPYYTAQRLSFRSVSPPPAKDPDSSIPRATQGRAPKAQGQRAQSRKAGPSKQARIGVDTGGTFTDLVLSVPGHPPRAAKVASTPDDPARAIATGLSQLGESADEIVHGSTVALNALLTGRVARTALITNAGFRDLIEVGRQDRPDLYALHPERTQPLVPRARRFTIEQRSWPDLGHQDGAPQIVEVERPDRASLKGLAERVAKSGAESVAICLLHSYADPSIEQRVARALRGLRIPITCSGELLAAHREFERFSTAIVDASLAPILSRYLTRLSESLGDKRLSILQSAGGTLPAKVAAQHPARVLLSGPAGGVVGAAHAAREAGLGAIATLDMGGTSTDVAFHDPDAGLVNATGGATIGGHPVALPTLDIHTIGCGGGSLVHVDTSGVLHVGPGSAGADPGPVAYGRGEELTVTDALVHLGLVTEGGFLNGFALDHKAVTRAFEALAQRLGTRSTQAAEAVLEVARAAMRRALGVMTMQRGHDPAQLPLVAFGGGGGLHAADLAGSLGMPGALIPTLPGVLSAFGMVHAEAAIDGTRTVLEPMKSWGVTKRRQAFQRLAQEGREALRQAGHAARSIEQECVLELRYKGQSHELAIPECSDPAAAFAERHEVRYGWNLPDAEVELVHLRHRSSVAAEVRGRRTPSPKVRAAPKSAVRVVASAHLGRRASIPRYVRERLEPGHRVKGPAVIEEFTATTVVPEGWRADVRPGGHLWLHRG